MLMFVILFRSLKLAAVAIVPNLVAAEVIPGATHYLPARYHAHLNERCKRFLKETT